MSGKIKKFILGIGMEVIIFIGLAISAYALTCQVRENACNAGENALFSMFSTTNAHAGSHGYYSQKVCCDEVTASVKDSCSADESEILSFFQANNSHVAQAGHYSKKLCAKYTTYPLGCSIKTSCDSANETCVVSLRSQTNSHVANCDYHSYKLCCGKLPDLYVNSSSIVNKSQPVFGNPVELNITVWNIGDSAATQVNVSCYANGTYFDSDVINSIPPDVSMQTPRYASCTWIAERIKNNISVRVDPDNNIKELNESNNEAWKIIDVNIGPTIVDLLLNGSSSNITVERNWAVNITGTVNNTEGTLYLYNNSVLIKSCAGARSCTDIESHPAAVGAEFNITAHYPSTQNYTNSSKTWWIKINNSLPTITAPVYNESEVLRGRGVYISCDAKDVNDNYDNLKVNISIRDTNNVWSNVSAGKAGEPTFYRSYQTNISSPTSPLGTYLVACSVEDLNGGRAQNSSTFLVWAGATVSINLNATSVGWGEPVNASGQAVYNDTGYVTSSTAAIKISGSTKCTDPTDSVGRYDCVFTAPQSLGTYTVIVEVTDKDTGKVFTNSATLTVMTTYGGAKPIVAEQVTCYEEPRIVQNPDGTITKTTVRICVWK